MRTGTEIVLTLALSLCGGGAGLLWSDSASAKSQADELREQGALIFGVLPSEAPNPENPVTPPKVKLGRMLYYDARLSKNHDVSCNTCHLLDAGGDDGAPTSTGHKGQLGGRNSPTSYNAALHVAQFWDGRAADVEEQAKGPPLNPIEMAMPDAAAVETVLRSVPGYGPLFQSAFPGEGQPITYDNMGRAIGAFERGLLTPAPFDAFLEGDDSALSSEQRRGLQAFMSKGCISCHAGPLVGGAIYQKLGLVHAYDDPDPGRYDVTKKDSDRQVFKVPSLRNAEKTAPYFHNGKVETLPEAVRLMGHHQLGLDLSDTDVAEIVAFIQSLSGTIDESYIARPELPASGPDTPAPDPS
jgi:cytochrome c peroxidase